MVNAIIAFLLGGSAWVVGSFILIDVYAVTIVVTGVIFLLVLLHYITSNNDNTARFDSYELVIVAVALTAASVLGMWATSYSLNTLIS